jgi:hypothetical protein
MLPIAPNGEDLAIAAAVRSIADLGIALDDAPAVLGDDIAEWEEELHAPARLVAVVRAALDSQRAGRSSLPQFDYFDLHDELCRKFGLETGEASALLSHISLISYLAGEEVMTAAQIDQLLSARDSRTFGWRPIRHVLRRIGTPPSISRQEVEDLVADDNGFQVALFADADESTSIDVVASVAEAMAFKGSLRRQLESLSGTDRFWPYLQMLHFQCILCHYWDHTPTLLYEFSPRGQAVGPVLDLYDAIVATGNPFLNNAKAIDRLDRRWAVSREGDPRGAEGLVGILEGLDDLAFHPRREMARWLRGWLLRQIELHTVQATAVTIDSVPELQKLLAAVAASETQTRGIIEQRVVDAISYSMHPPNQWHSRGIGDSVNASNLSRAKFGDCEFIDSKQRVVRAYEAHGGRLTDDYMAGHRRSLSRVADLRMVELETIAPAVDWTVEVLFVAHNLLAQRQTWTVDNLTIQLVPVTYQSLLSGVHARDVMPAARNCIVEPLNDRRTPESVREVFRSLI